MRLHSKNLWILIWMMSCVSATAQQNILVTTQVMLPSPRFLSDFSNQAQVMLYPVTNEDASLRISIKGDNGVLITTRPTYNPFNIVLTGAPMILSGFDIQDYFLPQNLLFAGITAQGVQQNGLPPGNYRLCVRVVNSDFSLISGDDPMGCSNFFSITLAEPPFLVNPSCGTIINSGMSNGITFSWTPATGAPPFTTYTLRIVEYPQEGMNPSVVLNSATTPVFFEKEIQGFSYFYGPTDPSLQPGKSYAWEVVARDSETKTQFKNNGRSEACWFKIQPPSGGLVVSPPVIPPGPGGSSVQLPFIPMSTVNGKLFYKYNAVVSGTSVTIPAGGVNSPGGGVFLSSPGTIPWSGGSSSTFTYNQGIGSSGAKPLPNIKISLVKKYIVKNGYYGPGNQVENFVIPDGGHFQPTAFQQAFPNSGQVLATTTTDANGNFTFTFLNPDSIGQVQENFTHGQPKENNDFVKGTVYSAYRIIVESPYYCSPENDIIVQPWEVKGAGEIVSLIKDYNLKIIVKSAKTTLQQIGGGGNPLNDTEVRVIRKNPQPGVQPDEGQGLNAPNPGGQGVMISKGTTNQNGEVNFTRLIRHQKDLNPDRYTIEARTNKQKGNYNYKDESVRYNAIWAAQMADFPFTGDMTKTTWNSQYKLENKTFEVSMWPDKPRVIGRVLNNQGKPMAGVKCVIMSVYTHAHNYNPSNFFRLVETGPDGYFEFNNLDVEISGQFPDLVVDGPARTFMIKVNGYRYYEQNFGILTMGQQMDLKSIKLEPDGMVSGRVVDDAGNAVAATVVFNDQISVNTTPVFTINPFALYQNFSAAVPSGNAKVKVIPSNPEYGIEEYTFVINKTSGSTPQNLGELKVSRSMHRISFVVKEKGSNKPVKDVTIVVKQSPVAPVKSDAQGKVSLSFASMAETFSLDIIPPDNVDLLPTALSVQNQNSTKPVDYGTVLLESAARISGTVTFGNDKKPLAGAEVFLNQGSGAVTAIAKTDNNGKYSLGKIPTSPSQVEITAGKSESGITIIAQTKTVDVTNTKVVDFNLSVFDKMSISDIYGFPVIVESLSDEGASATISGKFVKLPSNDNFQLDANNFMMEFTGVKMIKLSETNAQGVPLTRPDQKEVKTSALTIPLKFHNEFYATQTPSGDFILVKPDATNSGFIDGKVKIENGSFEFSEALVSFSKEALFLAEGTTPSTQVKTLAVKADPKKSYLLTDEKGGSLEYRLMGFDAASKSGKANINGSNITLNTTLSTDKIPLMNPSKFELELGDVKISKQGFEPFFNQPGTEFKLEQWTIKAEKWNLSKQYNGILISGGVIKTGLTDVPFNSLTIKPDDLAFSGFQFGNMSLSGVVPLEVLPSNANMMYDQKTGSDLKPHWRLAVLGSGSQPAARIKGLPGMESGATIDFQVFEVISNNESQVSFGNNAPSVTFHKVYKMKPVSLNNYNNYFQLSGLVDLGIPRVNNNFTGILEFSKKNNAVVMEVKTLPVVFDGPGKVRFTNTPSANTQKLEPGVFEATGKIKDEEGVELLVTLYRKVSDIYIDVKPAGQILPIGDGVISLTDVKGKMEVKNSDWDYFRFNGIMTGAGGVEGQQRLAFTIYGDIEANSQEVSLKNINTPFGGMNITYDFKNGRMTGDLNINKNMGGVGVNGTANLLVDAQGYFIIVGGNVSAPGIGTLQAGAMFGKYPSISGETKNRLMQYSYDKNVPATFSNGIGGFFITGMKTFPIEIPDIEVDLKVVSVAFGAKVGADARVWMNFAGPGTSFGIGAMVFAHAYFVCESMICTSFGADARAEMGMKGDYNTASGTFSLEGCGSFTVSAFGQQCVGALGACIDPCVDLGFTKSIKVNLLLNSKGDADITLGLGNCSGQQPLTGGW
jgi:TANFOR domain-containing protein